MSEWRPIETAPNGTMILCADMLAREAKHWAFVGWKTDISGETCVTTPDRMQKPCTHWMPLPEPPR